jgi:hypothetical protein
MSTVPLPEGITVTHGLRVSDTDEAGVMREVIIERLSDGCTGIRFLTVWKPEEEPAMTIFRLTERALDMLFFGLSQNLDDFPHIPTAESELQ